MKAVFIAYNMALSERVQQVIDKNFIRGFTRWQLTHGRGSKDGEPHYANHAWPSMNSSILTVIDDHKVAPLLKALREIDEQAPQHGLRAFVWDVTEQI